MGNEFNPDFLTNTLLSGRKKYFQLVVSLKNTRKKLHTIILNLDTNVGIRLYSQNLKVLAKAGIIDLDISWWPVVDL